jgi:hypothetical protein
MIKLTMEEALARFGFQMTIDETKLTPFQKYEYACKNLIWINNKYLLK